MVIIQYLKKCSVSLYFSDVAELFLPRIPFAIIVGPATSNSNIWLDFNILDINATERHPISLSGLWENSVSEEISADSYALPHWRTSLRVFNVW